MAFRETRIIRACRNAIPRRSGQRANARRERIRADMSRDTLARLAASLRSRARIEKRRYHRGHVRIPDEASPHCSRDSRILTGNGAAWSFDRVRRYLARSEFRRLHFATSARTAARIDDIAVICSAA